MSQNKPAGRVQFDDRGNAIWEWAVTTGSFGRDAADERLRRLENPSLSIAEEGPGPASGPVRANPLGTATGYNPYDSGKLDKKDKPRRKKDLRKLSEWLALRKQAAANKDKDGGG